MTICIVDGIIMAESLTQTLKNSQDVFRNESGILY